jgi:DNA repair protein RecO (recombination protein O)
MIKKEFFEHAIVFQAKTIREYDLIVKFLTPSQGMVESFAFGGRKSKRRFSGCFEELSYVIFKVRSPRCGNYFYLEEGILLDRFSNIHKNKTHFGIAINCKKFLDAVLIGYGEAKGIFELFLNLLKGLDNNSFKSTGNIPLFFRARVAGEMGYMPRIQSCNRCGRLLSNEPEIFFSPEKGNLFCIRCVRHRNGFILYPKEAFDLFCRVFLGSPDEWFNEKEVPYENIVARGIKIFVETHLRVKWHKGRFITI